MNILEVFEYNQHFVAMMNIINNARLNPPAKGHKHHIIPRCWFKMNGQEVDNSKNNLVLLTYEDHIKVHKLSMLCAIREELKSKMGFAVKRLLKGEFGGMKHTDETRALIKAKRALQVITEEHKKHISESLKGKPKPPRTKEHIEHLKKAGAGNNNRINKPSSEFGKKYIEHFGYGPAQNRRQYLTEHNWYRKHNKQCRWEIDNG